MSYSGPGFLLAARVIETVTQGPYGAFVQASVFEPAGMDSTTSGHFPLDQDGVAHGHHHGDAVEVAAVLTAMPGTGDLWTSAVDLESFARALRSRRLVSASAGAALQTAWVAVTEPPSSPRDPVVARACGYGVFVGTIAGEPAWFHPGDNPGYRSLQAWLPDTDVDIVVLANDDGPPLAAPVHQAITAVTSNQIVEKGRRSSL